jgi:flagellar biosynthesis/type III secretory pathway protein FliH
MTGFAERFIQQGIEKGRAQGIEQGMQRGEARMLTSLLQLRFGELPEAARQRLETADPDTLLRWSERVLAAESLEDVLR